MSEVRQLRKNVRSREEAPTPEYLAETFARLEEMMKNLEGRISEVAGGMSEQPGATKSEAANIGERVEQVLRYIVAFIHKLDLRQFLQAEEVDEFGYDAAFDEKIQPLFNFLYEKYWRVETHGVNHVPEKGKALLIANHSGVLPYDAEMVKCAVRNEHTLSRDVRFLVEDFVYYFPFLGTIMYRIGGVRACPENAIRLLEHDQAVVTFPEGVKGLGKLYSERYRLQRFGRGGFVRLAMKTGAPIVPIAIVGAEEIHPMIYRMTTFARLIGLPYIPITPTFPLLGPAGLIPLPTKWHIHFGEPISFDTYTPAQIDNPILVNKLSEEVRQRIQSMIADLLRKRTSIWS